MSFFLSYFSHWQKILTLSLSYILIIPGKSLSLSTNIDPVLEKNQIYNMSNRMTNLHMHSTNLFDVRASWPIPPTETPTVVKMEKTEVPLRVAAIPHALVLNKPQNTRPAEEECRWGPHCPICTKKEGTEDWNGKRHESQQRNHYPQSPQHPPAYDIPDRFSQHTKLEKEWNEKTECL